MGWRGGPFKIKFTKSGIGFSIKVAKDDLVFTSRGKWSKKKKQVVDMREVKSAKAKDLILYSEKLAEEINGKLWERKLFGIIGMGWAILTVMAFLKGKGIILLLLGMPLGVFLWKNRAVNLVYEREMGEDLFGILSRLQKCRDFWYILAWGESLEKKQNIKVEELIRKQDCVIKKRPPRFIRSNVEIFQIYCGKKHWCFLPDKLLYYDQSGAAVLNYEDLKIEQEVKEFVVGEVPLEGKQVGKTWRHVNQDGSRDRRFADNPELPIMLYSVIKVSGVVGLNWQFMCSKVR